jgi:transposase
MGLPPGVAKFRHPFMTTCEAERAKLTTVSLDLFVPLYEEFCALAKRLGSSNEQVEAMAAAPPVCQRLETSPGMGPLTATALGAAVSDAPHFKHGRQFAAG